MIIIKAAIYRIYDALVRNKVIESDDIGVTDTDRGVELRVKDKSPTVSGGGDTYNGYFKTTDNGDNTITVAAGKLKAGNSFVDVPETTVTATGRGFVRLIVTYSAGYTGAVSFATDLEGASDGNDVIVLHTVEWDSGVTAVNRQISGVALVTGRIV